MRIVEISPDLKEKALLDLYDFFHNKIPSHDSLCLFEGIIAVPAYTVIENYEADTVGKVKKRKPGKKVTGKVDDYALQINDGKTTLQYPIKDAMECIKLIPPTLPVSITTIK